MKLTNEMIEKIKEVIEEKELDYDYEYIGVRVQEVEFELGRVDHVSHKWIDGEETAEELDGLSVCEIDYIGVNNYFGDHVAIIASNKIAEYGEDAGEMVLEDAECVYILA